ncbi:beta-ketoacyl synthase N-terminal-like domain-containing protein [Psychromonas sp. Urea-02u-13]|uniref:beta-ketoacyl synthase N-terminal-like domain-containing protein n=1 Tax=Psychromonas sp. Urea-02u-13 TaxID=2058326 RepID=UPI000C329AC9|nr:beta-ketoacyl synthase N-terminal-like domain-containing protein [Psychromonas sp. Urea-02u-13]PKG37068.1 hypothetical protein CXF74_20820 [Psychromonas sp. Urea-02u-13]
MSIDKKLYIAGIGVISPVGFNTQMTVTAVEAGVSGYVLSDFDSHTGEPLKLALISDDIFNKIEIETGLELDQGNRFNMRHDRITIMATIALQEACSKLKSDKAVPFIMAHSEYPYDKTDLSSLTDNLADHVSPWIDSKLTRSLSSGRPASIEAIDMIFNYLYDSEHDYFIVGGSDSYIDEELIQKLDAEDRLLYMNNADGFVAGEGAAYLVLTKKPELALIKNNQAISIAPPGISEEQGHLNSQLPYKGEGLYLAFKGALKSPIKQKISTIYSSLNGEHHWAKELAVAQMRNNPFLSEQVEIKHPAECYGDIGAATSTMLIALSAHDLWNTKTIDTHLVYSSSDGPKRGVLIVEKVNVK